MDVVTRNPHVTESEVAFYIIKVFEGFGRMRSYGIANMGLMPGDLFLTRPDSDKLKISYFGLASLIYSSKLASFDYGMLEFVAPETADGEGFGLPADMCSVGVISYLLLPLFHLLEEKPIEKLFAVYNPDRSIFIRKPLATF